MLKHFRIKVSKLLSIFYYTLVLLNERIHCFNFLEMTGEIIKEEDESEYIDVKEEI